jgi:hypothetical protein
VKATGIGDGGRKDGMEYPPVRLQRGMRGPGLPSGLGSWATSTCIDHCSLSPLWCELEPDFGRSQKLRCSRLAA